MSITKFEVGKKYRFLKKSVGDGKLYNGVDAEIGQEFTVHEIDDEKDVYTKDVTFQGMKDTSKGWIVYGNYPELPTTLDDFEEVVGNLDKVYTLIPSDVHPEEEEEEENIFPDLIKEVIVLQQEHNLVLMFHGGEVVVNFENSDTEYQVSSQEELTNLIEASKVLQRFERKVDYDEPVTKN